MTRIQKRLIQVVISESGYETAESLLNDNFNNNASRYFCADMITRICGWSKNRTLAILNEARDADFIDYEPQMGKYSLSLTDKALKSMIAK
jgi:hypothetical protein